MAMTVHPLSPVIGAEIRGVDARAIDAAEAGDIRAAFARHHVIVLRGQTLDAAAQQAVGRIFGPAVNLRTVQERPNQEYQYVTNRPYDGMTGILPEGEMQFHADQCFRERPSRVTLLYAIEVPAKGGNTLFASAVAAYAALPAAMRARLATLAAVHAYDYAAGARIKAEPSPEAPRATHPLVIRHPESGAPILYVNRLMTHHIVGLPRAESDPLLDALYAHIEQRQFIYEHAWRPGDLVAWDNLATLHARTDFDPSENRVLRRITVAGTRPEPATAQAA